MATVVKTLPMTVDALIGGEGVVAGMDAPGKIVTLRLIPVPGTKDGDSDLPGTGKAGALEVPFTPEAIAKFGLQYGDRLDLVIQRP